MTASDQHPFALISQPYKEHLHISYASAKGSAMAIAQRLHENLELETPFKPLNKYTPPEINKDEKTTVDAFSEQDWKHNCETYSNNGLKLDGKLIHHLLLVVSTTGNGDLPENGDRFYRKLKRIARRNNFKQLRNLSFSILALGDSNYSDFCGAGKKVRTVFSDLGAKEVLPIATADDATGMEEVVEKWLQDVESMVQSQCSKENQHTEESAPQTTESQQVIASPSTPTTPSHDQDKTTTGNDLSVIKLKPSTETPSQLDLFHFGNFLHETFQSQRFLNIEHVPLKRAKYLTTPEKSSKTTIHLEVDISENKQFHNYQPGDAIGVIPPNEDSRVEKLFRLLNLSLEEAKTSVYDIECTDSKKEHLFPRHIACPNTLFDMLKYYIDLTAQVTISQLKTLSQYCYDESERRQMASFTSPININQFRIHIQNPHTNITELLERFPSCQPSVPILLQILPPQQPRYYSISSSPLKYPKEIHFAFNILEYVCPRPYEQKKRGLCTSYLAGLADRRIHGVEKKIFIPMFMRSTPEFRLPKDSKTPIIMIGPGTGITPFRSFIQHRIATNNTDESANWLLHGCQNRAVDFLYGDELSEYEKKHKLTLLVVSSRVSGHAGWNSGYFVQDLIYEYASDIVELIEEQGGYLYMCGDAGKICTNVCNALKYIFHEELDISIEKAGEKLQQLKEEGRFQIDAW